MLIQQVRSLVFLCLLLTGCSGSPPSVSEGGLTPGRLTSTDKFVQLPKDLIAEIEGNYLKAYRLIKPESQEKDGEILVRIPRRSLDLVVTLAGQGSEVLKANGEFRAGRGGGFLDLAEWVSGIRGDFFWSIKAQLLENMDPSKLKVYFVSQAPVVSIDKENWGMGCGKYSEISKFYRTTLSQGGWRLNSTRQRYVYSMVGTYLFAYNSGEELYISTFTFTDSRYSDRLCSSQLTRSNDNN